MGREQLHKRFTSDQVRTILLWYEDGTITQVEACERLQCSRSRFFRLLESYRQNTETFTILPKRESWVTRAPIAPTVEKEIRRALEQERSLIENPAMPIRTYNYTAVRDELVERTGTALSIETVRRRAHTWGFVTGTRKKHAVHDRAVLTTAVGQLFQHDSSTHLWSPFAEEKWVLITTLDDYSRRLLYAALIQDETSWAHIQAAEAVLTGIGVGTAYYADSHSIFRFVCNRDSIWRMQRKRTDDVDTEWKRAVKTAGMDVWHALSPQAKGKIERPYRWLQDRLVRRCAKEGVRTIDDARVLLAEEVTRYNERQVHSTTKEIPLLRFEQAVRERRSQLRSFVLPPPFTSPKDIFCLLEERIVDGYRRVSWRHHQMEVPRTVPVGARVELHIIPDAARPEIRIWYGDSVRQVVLLQKN
jgi:hypothetical protein